MKKPGLRKNDGTKNSNFGNVRHRVDEMAFEVAL